jgi:hypothetical protein
MMVRICYHGENRLSWGEQITLIMLNPPLLDSIASVFILTYILIINSFYFFKLIFFNYKYCYYAS